MSSSRQVVYLLVSTTVLALVLESQVDGALLVLTQKLRPKLLIIPTLPRKRKAKLIPLPLLLPVLLPRKRVRTGKGSKLAKGTAFAAGAIIASSITKAKVKKTLKPKFGRRLVKTARVDISVDKKAPVKLFPKITVDHSGHDSDWDSD
jgi:hypothetical protein